MIRHVFFQVCGTTVQSHAGHVYQNEMHVTAIAGCCMVPPRVLRSKEHRLNMMITLLFVSMAEATVQCVVIGYVSGIDYLQYLVPSFAH